MCRIFRCFNLARFCRYGGTWTLLQSHISTLAKVLQFSQIGPIGLSVLGCQDGMQEMFHAAWDRNYETCTWLFGHNTIIKKPTASDGVIKKMGIYCRKQQFRCKNDDNHVKPRPWGHCSIMTKRCGVLCCLAADYLAGLSWDVFTIFYTKKYDGNQQCPLPTSNFIFGTSSLKLHVRFRVYLSNPTIKCRSTFLNLVVPSESERMQCHSIPLRQLSGQTYCKSFSSQGKNNVKQCSLLGGASHFANG